MMNSIGQTETNDSESQSKLKTMTMYVNDIDKHRIFEYMTKISKNIYNSTIFCTTVFMKYKQTIFKEVYQLVKKLISNNICDVSTIEAKIYELYDMKYKYYIEVNQIIKNNNNIIYSFIKNIMKTIILVNDNYFIIREIIIHNVLKITDIKYTNENKNELVIDIIDDILESIYNKNYYNTKNQLMNRIPITIQNTNFINQVKNNEHIIQKKKKISWKAKINNIIPKNLVSDNNIIGRFVYKHIKNEIDKLPSDVIINIIQKAYNGYMSFFALRKKGIKCNIPKYLDKNAHYNIPFFKNSMKIVEKNHKLMIRLTVGKYIANNYRDIIKNSSLVCVNNNENTEYKKYISFHKLKKNNKKINKTNNYVFDSHNTHIDKKNKHIIDSYYVYIDIPNKLIPDNIKYMEIKPLYENHKYKICLIYEEINNSKQQHTKVSVNDSISIDLGIKSLMTIYDPTGKQIIIDGNYLNWLNKSYNKKIDNLKQHTKLVNKTNTSVQIRNLLIDRENKINNYFNRIVKWLVINYSHKKLMIIGYNKLWKTKVSMGSKMNRMFYQIPYCKLLDKLKNKMCQTDILLKFNEEAYTSKCDALALEEITFHKKYLGERLKRGLFSSSINKLINADLNGAINIMRKFFVKNGCEIKAITGINLCNPVRANILYEVLNQ